MKSINFLLLAITMISVSCERNDDPELGDMEILIGSWKDPVFQDSLVTYSRTSSISDAEIGLTFNEDHEFILRTIAGGCATPPVTYADYFGTWTISDSIIHITVEYWEGIGEYEWKITSLDNNRLSFIEFP